jgi:hypothetical protein
MREEPLSSPLVQGPPWLFIVLVSPTSDPTGKTLTAKRRGFPEREFRNALDSRVSLHDGEWLKSRQKRWLSKTNTRR